jgi:hypothetical protein
LIFLSFYLFLKNPIIFQEPNYFQKTQLFSKNPTIFKKPNYFFNTPIIFKKPNYFQKRPIFKFGAMWATSLNKTKDFLGINLAKKTMILRGNPVFTSYLYVLSRWLMCVDGVVLVEVRESVGAKNIFLG